MLKLQIYVILAVAAMSCTSQEITAKLKCGNPPKKINDDSCKKALTQLIPYVHKDTGNLVRDESAFQVTCPDCKLTIGTSNGGNLTVLYDKVEKGLNNLLMDCPGKGAFIGMSDGSTNKDPKTDTGARLTIEYPSVEVENCAMI